MKALFNACASVVVLPAALIYWLGALVRQRDRAFSGWSQFFALIPGTSGEFLRRAFYQLVLPRCGSDASLGFGTILSHPTASLGSRVYVGPFGVIGAVTIEDDVLIGSHVSIMNGACQHGIDRLDLPIREQPGVYTPVTIGRDSWIGERAVIAADVGRHCVVGAGAVVLKPIPDYAVAVGVPARVVRFRNESETPLPEESPVESARVAQPA